MNEMHLLATFRYVAMNPTKARRVSLAVDWPWSSTPAPLNDHDDERVKVQPLLDRIDDGGQFCNDLKNRAVLRSFGSLMTKPATAIRRG